MIFISGTASSLSDLRQDIVDACTSNGWAWNASKEVISKGNLSATLTLITPGTSQSRLQLNPGTGIDGAGDILNRVDGVACSVRDLGDVPVTWPVSYRIFLYDNPDLFVLTFNHDGAYHQWMALGQGINLGCTGDSGRVPLFWGTYTPSTVYFGLGYSGATSIANQSTAPVGAVVPFFNGGNYSGRVDYCNAGAFTNEPAAFNLNNDAANIPWGLLNQHGTAGGPPQGTVFDCLNARCSSYQALLQQPNAWNGDSALVPIRPLAYRPSGFFSYVFEVPHVRLIRNDYIDDFSIITQGAQQWMVIPCRRKNVVTRQMGPGSPGSQWAEHSGTFALALPYEGP